MNKVWFVIRNDQHQGPFTMEDLASLSLSGKVDDETLLWKEGLEDYIEYRDVLLDSQGVPDLPPPLPLDAVVNNSVEIKLDLDDTDESNAIDEREFENENEIEQEFVSDFLLESELESELETEFEAEPEIDYDKKLEDFNLDSIQESEQELTSYKWIAFIIIPLFLSAVFYFSLPLLNKVQRPAKMLLTSFDSLENLIQSDIDENQFEFYVSKDRSSIWLGTNIPYDGDLVLKINSIYQKHLGKEEVEAISYGKLKNHLASFDNISFSAGERINEGYYSIEVYTTKPMTVPLLKKYSKERKKEFRYFNTVYLGHLQIEKFSQILNKRLEQEQNNDQRFWEELKQKYLTIKMITLQIQNAINRVFEKNDIEWKKKVLNFENEYKNKYGDFFTSFVMANEKSYSELKEKEFPDKLEVISNYTRLSRIAKNIGTHTMDVLHKLEMATEQDEELQVSAQLGLSAIADQCDQKIDMIDSKQKD